MDRRTRKLAPGSLVRLADGDRMLGLAAFNAESRIAARMLDTDSEAMVDAAWFAARLRRAQALREQLFEKPYWRLVHAEGDGLPGVVVDRFGDAAVVQPNAAWADRAMDELIAALADVTGCKTIIVNATSRVRKLEGLEDAHYVARGVVDAPVEVPMNGATYIADVVGGQKTGLYYDQRPNHAFVQRLARGRRVLDVFSHVGGFSLAALAGGAESALAIDGSRPALDLATQGAERTGVADRFETRQGDAGETMEALAGQRFDIVICDPPAFVPHKSALAAGLRAYERIARLAAGLVEPDGVLVLCSCSHAAGIDAFHKACVDGIRRAGRTGAMIHSGRAGPDHPVHIGLPETGYLKSLVFRLHG